MSFLKRMHKKKCADSEKSPPKVTKLERDVPDKLDKTKFRVNSSRARNVSIEWM